MTLSKILNLTSFIGQLIKIAIDIKRQNKISLISRNPELDSMASLF